jgi:hypothetical protein
MNEKGPKNKQKADCCGEKGCCPSPEDTTGQQPPGMKRWWKIGVFSLGVLLIIGATAYSLITRHTSASSPSIDSSALRQISSNSWSNAVAGMGIGDLVWTQELDSTFSNHDLVFVILPENDGGSSDILSNRVSEAASKIEAKGALVGTLTLSASDPEFSTTLQRLAIGQLPAVLVFSTTGNGAIMTGDITEGALLQTYITVSQPVCPPGSSPGCCGK